MKNYFVLLLFLTVSVVNIQAQTSQEDVRNAQEKFKIEKKTFVTKHIQLDEESSSEFWDIYDEYEEKRMIIGKERFNLLLHHLNNQTVYEDKELDREIKKFIKNRKETDELIERYYNKLKKKVGVQYAAKFYQIEIYFYSIVRTNYMKKIPFFQSLEN